MRDPAKILEGKAHDAVVEVRGDGFSVSVEIAQAEVAHSPLRLQLHQLGPFHDAAFAHEDGVPAGSPDADEGDVRGASAVKDPAYVRIAQEGVARRAVRRHAGSGQGRGAAAEEMGEPADELGGMRVAAGVHHPAQPLDHHDAAQLAVRVEALYETVRARRRG